MGQKPHFSSVFSRWMLLALPLDGKCDGNLFCFLQLPTKTGACWHLHGFFELSSNRRGLVRCFKRIFFTAGYRRPQVKNDFFGKWFLKQPFHTSSFSGPPFLIPKMWMIRYLKLCWMKWKPCSFAVDFWVFHLYSWGRIFGGCGSAQVTCGMVKTWRKKERLNEIGVNLRFGQRCNGSPKSGHVLGKGTAAVVLFRAKEQNALCPCCSNLPPASIGTADLHEAGTAKVPHSQL